MRSITIFIILLSILTFACDSVRKKTKETINKGGETVGKTATEFIEGVSEGIDQTLQCELAISEELQKKGLKTGKFSIENNAIGGENNLLVLYLIFDQDIAQQFTAKAYDKNDLEIGRSKVIIDSKAGDAGYFDFPFDKRTYIEARSKISIE